MHILAAFSGLSGFIKTEDMKLEGNSGASRGGIGGEGIGDGLDQRTLYSCMTFSNNNHKIIVLGLTGDDNISYLGVFLFLFLFFY